MRRRFFCSLPFGADWLSFCGNSENMCLKYLLFTWLNLFSLGLFAQQEDSQRVDSLQLNGHVTNGNKTERPFRGSIQRDTLRTISVSRYLVHAPDVSNVESGENGMIVLNVKVDASGKIVGTPTVLKNRTTIADIRVIDLVIQSVVEGCLYNASEKELEELSLTIRIRAD